MKKRIAAFLLVAVCALTASTLTARADMIAEPYGNSFYDRHRAGCKILGRSFYANGEDGSVALVEAPGSKKETAVIENGETLYIMFTYKHKGEQWGVTELNTPSGRSSGWVPMDQLLLVYDYISFEEEHGSEFYTYYGDYVSLVAAEAACLWSWPGSGTVEYTLTVGDEVLGHFFGITIAYKDKDEREWGFVGYWMGIRNVWVCLTDPANGDIPAFNPPPKPELWELPVSGDTPRSGISTELLAILLVIVLVAGTVVPTRLFRKPNKRSGNDDSENG